MFTFFNTLVLFCILSRVLSGHFFNMCSWKSEMVVICLHMISCNSRSSKLKLFSFLTALSIQSILKRLLLSWRGYPQSTNNSFEGKNILKCSQSLGTYKMIVAKINKNLNNNIAFSWIKNVKCFLLFNWKRHQKTVKIILHPLNELEFPHSDRKGWL